MSSYIDVRRFEIEELNFGELQDVFNSLLCAADLLEYEYNISGAVFEAHIGVSDSVAKKVYSTYISFVKDSTIKYFLYLGVFEDGVVLNMNAYVDKDIKLLGCGLKKETLYSLMKAL